LGSEAREEKGRFKICLQNRALGENQETTPGLWRTRLNRGEDLGAKSCHTGIVGMMNKKNQKARKRKRQRTIQDERRKEDV